MRSPSLSTCRRTRRLLIYWTAGFLSSAHRSSRARRASADCCPFLSSSSSCIPSTVFQSQRPRTNAARRKQFCLSVAVYPSSVCVACVNECLGGRERDIMAAAVKTTTSPMANYGAGAGVVFAEELDFYLDMALNECQRWLEVGNTRT